MRRTWTRGTCWVLLFALFAADGRAQQGAKYLVIAADVYAGIVLPLAQWKTQKGVPAVVVPVSLIGTSPAQIQTWIRNAWTNWPIRPEYVLLVGNPSQIPAYGQTTDCFYGNMTGDYVMEIAVGRLFANSTRECSTQVNKWLDYERPRDLSDTTWYRKGLTAVREDSPDDSLYWNDSRVLHGYWRDRGFTVIDSLSMNRGNTSAQVNAAASNGRMFLTYRGQGVGTWWSPFNTVDPFSWNNGTRMPIGVGGTCATVTLEAGATMYADKFVRAGTPDGLGGAVAYFGTTQSMTSGSRYRSAVYRGFFKAIYDEKNCRLGLAANRGRWRVDSLYHLQARYEEWNLLGDPELNIWTAVPRVANIEYPPLIVMGPQQFPVRVTADGAPVAGARVCAWLDTSVYAVGLTDGTGVVMLEINPSHVGTMLVTVTGQNLRPCEGTCQVSTGNAPYLTMGSLEVDDWLGNHDGVLNPGEGVGLHVNLRNIGHVTAAGVRARLQVPGGRVQVIDSSAFYGDILPDSVSRGDGFELRVDSSVGEGYALPARLMAFDETGDTWDFPVSMVVRAGSLTVMAATLLDQAPGGNGNSRLGRSEAGRLLLTLQNSGGARLDGVRCVVEAVDTNVVVTDSLGFYGTLVAGQVKAGEFDWFVVSAGPGLPRQQPVRFRARLYGDGGTYRRWDTCGFEIQSEQGLAGDPTGPDRYGYWCYDDTDTSSGRSPSYTWMELAPPGPGTAVPQVSDSDAFTLTLPLPFPFRMYGVTDNFVSVNSNGWLCLGYTTFRSGYNRPIPDTTGPGLIMGAFWDDLNPDESRSGNGTAYQYYDTAGHRWLVEFKDYSHYGQQNIRETFQAILYDPQYRQSPTGDGDIEFLYNRVSLNSGCTVGIEDATEIDGIQYLYNNTHAPTAAYLQAGRALRFTTWPPRTASAPWLVLERVSITDSLHGNGNGLNEAGETLDVVVTLRNRGQFDAVATEAVARCLEPDAVVLDSAAGFGTVVPAGQAANAAHPFVIGIAELPRDSLVDIGLAITANGYATGGWFTMPLDGVTGLASVESVLPRAGLGSVRPNPLRGMGSVVFVLVRPGNVDLALFDAAGRRVRTLARGQLEAGVASARVDATTLPAGVYFCRLGIHDGVSGGRYVRKFSVAH